MSSFVLAPVVEADFDRMLKYTDEAGGTLAAPLLFATWPAQDPVATARRNAWSMEQQKWQFRNDPSARFMKVEDASTREIVSLARWHRYTNGYPQADIYTEIDVFAPPGTRANFAEGLNGPLHAGLLGAACKRRADYVNPGVSWILTTLITRARWRRQGAGGMLLQWGIQQAARDGAPAYLEAVPSAVSTYKRHGFEHIQDTKVDCSDWGMGGEFVLAVMRKAK
ncbi:hypothetical protein PV05_09024 [Exophiala xenobiotica]|uniref:N-acetyltransferase domain-containing protein n=1 Tax=Exophiala xenobiotica TaxID=348802 RepID=A0A0D2EFR5_9EURO|nr:uncharacterized protein PV05_09024 [Exophiala xenobiotica]KIW53450.1 hypothetical protein PV05_09024 [Exophiala xenobiotica]